MSDKPIPPSVAEYTLQERQQLLTTIARYETTAENYELLQAKVDEQAREVERLTVELDHCRGVATNRGLEIAALKAQPSGVVLPERDDRAAYEAFYTERAKTLPLALGNAPLRYSGGQYINDFALFGWMVWEACLSEVARLNSSPVGAGESCDCGGSPHTGQCLYEHFLSYSSLADHPMLRYAYFHGAGFSGEAEQHASAPNHSEQVRDGWVLAPQEIHLSASDIELINGMCGDGNEEGGYGPYQDGTLYIGYALQDDGSKVYGLHISCDECPEEGVTTLAEFAAAPSAGSQEQA